MSAHTLLTLHNLAVLDAFFAGVRRVLAERPPEAFSEEIARFEQSYDGKLGVLAEARKDWTAVTLARGKGRMAREREKQQQETLGTAVELD
jgi:queuine tRNA-ribosyltransferase